MTFGSTETKKGESLPAAEGPVVGHESPWSVPNNTFNGQLLWDRDSSVYGIDSKVRPTVTLGYQSRRQDLNHTPLVPGHNRRLIPEEFLQD